MNWIRIETLKEYYLYSLHPKLSEYTLMYGSLKGKSMYNMALKAMEKPTLTGFIKYVKNSIKTCPIKDRVIIFKNKNPKLK